MALSCQCIEPREAEHTSAAPAVNKPTVGDTSRAPAKKRAMRHMNKGAPAKQEDNKG